MINIIGFKIVSNNLDLNGYSIANYISRSYPVLHSEDNNYLQKWQFIK